MRLLIISRDFPNIIGGVSDHTHHLQRALSMKDSEVYVLTSRDKRIVGEIADSVSVLPFVDKWGIRGLIKIIREIKKINPDWILLQYVPHMYSSYAVPFYIAALLDREDCGNTLRHRAG